MLPQVDERMKLVIDSHGHSSKIQKLIFFQGGNALISISNDKTIRMWDVSTGHLRTTIRGYIEDGSLGKLYAGTLSPDEQVLAVGGLLGVVGENDSLALESVKDLADLKFQVGQIRLFDLRNNQQIAVLTGHANVIYDLAFSADGQWLASASADRMIRIWNISNPYEPYLIGLLEGHDAQVISVAFSPDKRQLISASYDGTLRLWQLPAQLSLEKTLDDLSVLTMKRHEGKINCVAYSPDGTLIASGGDDRQILLWNARGKFVKQLDRYLGSVMTLNFSADGTKLVAAGESAAPPIVYDVRSGQKIAYFPGHVDTVNASAFLGNEQIATAGSDNIIYIWNARTGSQEQQMLGKGRKVLHVAFGNDLRVAFGNDDYSPSNYQSLVQTHPEFFPLSQIFDFQTFVLQPLARSDDEFDPMRETGRNVQMTLLSPEQLRLGESVVLSNDAKRDGLLRAYTVASDGTVIIGSSFSLKSYRPNGELLQTFSGHTDEVYSVSLSKDEQYVVSSSGDQTIRLWNRLTGECLAALFVASDGEWVCWTPKGFYVASPTGEQYIGWHLNQGMNREAAYYPAGDFQKLYQQTDLVRNTIAFRSFNAAFDQLQRDYAGQTEECTPTSIAAPIIEWRLPTSESVLTTLSKQFRIQAAVLFPKKNPIRQVFIKINNTLHPIPQESVTPSEKGIELDYAIDLPSRQNEISIVAESELSQVFSAPRIVEISTTELSTQQRRLALLIGNADYLHEAKLPNPVNDVRRMKEALARLGFEVMVYENLSQPEIKRAIDAFGEQLPNFDVGMFFYSGHGAQFNGNNYLIPIEINMKKRHALQYDAVDMERVLSVMDIEQNMTNIVILDACRDNPIEQYASKGMGGGGGLAMMSAPVGTLIAYATAPGKVAYDNPERSNSIYTSVLLEQIETPGLEITTMFRNVRNVVLEMTKNENPQQEPWESTSLRGEFYFHPVGK